MKVSHFIREDTHNFFFFFCGRTYKALSPPLMAYWSVPLIRGGILFFNGRLIFHILDVENEPRKTSVPSYVE